VSDQIQKADQGRIIDYPFLKAQANAQMWEQVANEYKTALDRYKDALEQIRGTILAASVQRRAAERALEIAEEVLGYGDPE
jgi:glycine cleavage system protein P-like pyridoxal-binding family